MSSEELREPQVREAESMPRTPSRQEEEESLQGLVLQAAEWAEEVCLNHGFDSEAGGGRRIRGFVRWMHQRHAFTAAIGPRQQQWAPTPANHFEGPCWCGFLPSTEETRLAEQGALLD